MDSKKIIITAGGTGGHIFPAIAVAMGLKDRGHNVLIVGDPKIKKYAIESGFDYRMVSSGYSLKNFRSLRNIIRGIWQSFAVVRRFMPDLVIGFGSYITLPMLVATRLKRIKFCLHEQNSHIGDVNRLFLKNAKCLFTSFQEMYGININYSDKIFFAGSPIRRSVAKLCAVSEYKYPEDNEKFNILITSGSGGASFFSREFTKVFAHIKKEIKSKINIFHQVKQEEELDIVKNFYSRELIKSEVKLFFEDMPEKLLKSHLAIARSGMGTASELAAMGRPTIFVPSPNVKNNHQLSNANFFKRNEACIVLEENCFIPSDFAARLESLIGSREELENLSANIRKLSAIDAEEKIVEYINDLLLL
ncbi:MAG: UDP-N-acetylglucosamine--N-acetylmuramyl-(pentapeptide) pyrophosphoryl-undecaprenol N-acetylglucosamine transferase [Rickettsiales bacterium]|jgi:UDP-N-acetylglucosamine--N-acetylmuramyl-(pentapeptide) pyrophosphoryl-undecaprenol N-acetylglucosamine transferase|nr:UDP-N-acetylglucosamine--N-acetylmuramyl-(pentapeptide) pyrophosphoryl-undecaprenol N-acetylglucosamine transferase [Rickettsiales bacterium]